MEGKVSMTLKKEKAFEEKIKEKVSLTKWKEKITEAKWT